VVSPAGGDVTPIRSRASELIAFFFLLRVGKYTPPLTDQGTQTTQIRRKDLQFWKRQPTGLIIRLSPMSPLAKLWQADSVTITLDNQKKGQREATLHHEALPTNPLCPVQACTCHFAQIRTCDPQHPLATISLYGPNKHVLARQMAAGIQRGAVRSISMIWM
jgi:hypothetical protein